MKDLLNRYHPTDPQEQKDQQLINTLIHSTPRCFWRDCFPDHITASALVVSPDRTQILLNRHRIFNKWLCFGGHCDGETDVRAVAMREAQEESGLQNLSFLTPEILDIDRHVIPANPRKGEPEHWHNDIRFALIAGDKNFQISDESTELRWCGFDTALTLVTDATMRRLIDKTKSLLNN